MREFSEELSKHLAGETTTLCTCWRVNRTDGVTIGMTDHDRNITFEGTVFEAATGVSGSALSSSADLAVDNSVIEGVLDTPSLSAASLSAGHFDDATLEVWRVNWQSPDMRFLQKTGRLGEIRQTQNGYSVELRALSDHLDQTTGRIFQFTCDANLGDDRCGVDSESVFFKGEGSVLTGATQDHFSVSGLNGFESDWFSLGVLIFTDGFHKGRRFHVKSHAAIGEDVSLTLWHPLPKTPVFGDDFQIIAGCDKRFETCRTKFQNGQSFRGFPHMPGNDFVTSYPLRGEGNDGGSRT